MTSTFNPHSAMTPKDREEYVIARTRDIAFDRVYEMWKKRQGQGLTQADLAAAIGADEGWVSKKLAGPGNWTLRTLARFIAGLDGEIDLIIYDLKDPPRDLTNYNAYREWDDLIVTEDDTSTLDRIVMFDSDLEIAGTASPENTSNTMVR